MKNYFPHYSITQIGDPSAYYYEGKPKLFITQSVYNAIREIGFYVAANAIMDDHTVAVFHVRIREVEA